jgi:hypothetical protein
MPGQGTDIWSSTSSTRPTVHIPSILNEITRRLISLSMTGKVLRLEPNLISICTPNAIRSKIATPFAMTEVLTRVAAYGPGTKFEKVLYSCIAAFEHP